MYGLITMLILSTPLSQVKSEVIHDPTITGDPDFSADDLAYAIYKEVSEDFWNNVDKLAPKVLRLSYDQRMDLSRVFKKKHGWDVERYLTEEVSGNLVGLYDYAFRSPPSLLAKLIKEGIEKGSDTSMEEIMCAQDNQMKSSIKESYLLKYLTELEDDFKRYKADDRPYREAMEKYCWPPREEQLKINGEVAKDEAKALKDLLNDSDKEKFKLKLKEFLGKYTEGDLKLIFQKYRDGERGIDNDVDDIFIGDEKSAYGTLVRYIENTCKYYADALHHAVDGFGTDVNRINRITLTRCERDMMCIANAYKNEYGETFTQRLKWDLVAEGRYLECIRILCGKK